MTDDINDIGDLGETGRIDDLRAPVQPNPYAGLAVRYMSRTGDDAAQAPYTLFDVEPCSPTIGAEIGGIDLSRPLGDELFAELHRALLEWKVLFFRDQSLTAERHRDLAARWGEPEVHPFLDKAGIPEVVRLARDANSPGSENIWHTDASFETRPPMGSILRAVELPPVGGDTLWADMAAAYDGLDDELKDLLDGKVAVHDFTHNFGRGMEPRRLAAMREKYPPVEHPVIRTHPETGRRILYVNKVFTSHIVGMAPDDSRALIDRLLQECKHPEYQVRLRWRPGTVAFWDNRVTQHYASVDYYPHRRVMERVTIVGDRPV